MIEPSTQLAHALNVVRNDQCNPARIALQLRDNADASPIAGLYLHIPFCFHKCHYCDFYSLVEPEGRTEARYDQFVDRMIAEMRLRAGQFLLRPATIFCGGGTPTLLGAPWWRRILAALREHADLSQLEEFTVEANPETVTPELLDALVAGGVNRISIGCQSFDPTLLKTLERWHDPTSVPRAVEMARAAGITNFNLDLIFGIPGETMQLLDSDLDQAMAIGPAHMSCYGLTYEPNTAMTQRLKMGQFTPIDEEVERTMYDRVMTRLAGAGFEHYEVSNWGRRRAGGSAARCQHNMLYWRNGNWLGIGPAAASHVAGHRWKNVPHLGKYLAAQGEPPTQDYEHLDQSSRIGELLMLGLRLLDGVGLDWVNEHVPPNSPRRAELETLIAAGMLSRTTNRLRLSREGLFIADAVIGKLL